MRINRCYHTTNNFGSNDFGIKWNLRASHLFITLLLLLFSHVKLIYVNKSSKHPLNLLAFLFVLLVLVKVKINGIRNPENRGARTEWEYLCSLNNNNRNNLPQYEIIILQKQKFGSQKQVNRKHENTCKVRSMYSSLLRFSFPCAAVPFNWDLRCLFICFYLLYPCKINDFNFIYIIECVRVCECAHTL